MKTKLITNLDSLMIFTGKNANTNAKALEDREYDVFSDEHIGTLKLTKDYDSVFSNTQSEIFVETTPRYKSAKDLTNIAYTYIINRSSIKPTNNTQMYLDDRGDISFLYDFDNGLGHEIDNAKSIPASDLMLYFSSINNGMFNKQKYYSKHKEVESLSNNGIKYFWRQQGSYFTIYDENTYSDTKHENGNDFISYSLENITVQEMLWDESENAYIPQYEKKTVENEDGTTSTLEVPKMLNKHKLEYENSFKEIFISKLEDCVERFKGKYEENMLSYYLYDLDSTLQTIANTYSFGQNKINTNVNFDGEFNNWFDNRISFNIESPETSNIVNIAPSENYWFNLGTKDDNGKDVVLMEKQLSNSEELWLTIPEQKDYSNLSILSPYKIKRLDFSNVANSLVGTLDLSCKYKKKISSIDKIETNWINEKGSLLEEIIIGKEGVDCKLTNIVGLEYFPNLKKLDLVGCNNLDNDPDFNSMKSLEEFYLKSSNISVFNPAYGSTIKMAQLPSCIESIILNKTTFTSANSIDYDVNSKLTTLELNNVTGIDTLSFVSKWIDALKNDNLLDTGLVNYVNLNGVDWNYVPSQLLKDLKVIELNEFTGNVDVWGEGVDQDIYRKDYRELVSLFGTKSVLLPGEESSDDLHINVKVGANAFNIKLQIIEQYNHIYTEINDDGILETITELKEREIEKYKFAINVDNTKTGNSFLDLVGSNPENVFDRIEKSKFVNINNISIGWTMQLPSPLDLPNKSENIKQINIGDVLLFNKQTLIIVTKNVSNINQNYTKLGKISNVDLMYDLLNDTFELDYLYSLSCMEDEIIVPTVDDDNYVEIEYDQTNYIDVEYDQTNYIDVEYAKN